MLDVISFVNDEKAAIAEYVKSMKVKPRLAIITDDKNFDANQSYIRSKTNFAMDVGVECAVIVIKTGDIFLPKLNDFDGAIVQYPFRDYTFDEFREFVSAYVPPSKDVDGLTYGTHYKPCTPLGIYTYLEHLWATHPALAGKKRLCVNVVGFGGLVGKPLVEMLDKDDRYSTVVTRSKTPEDVAKEYRDVADVVVCATPKHNLFTSVEEGKVYVDCGCNLVEGKLLGNVSRECYSPEALVTPVPGGVGRLTVLALFHTLLKATGR